MFDIAIEGLPIVNKTIGVMGGKEVAVLAKNYFKDILTAVFDYKNKAQWQSVFLKNKPVTETIGGFITDRLAGELIGKYSSIWEKSFTDSGIKQDLAVQIIREYSIKTKEYSSEILNYILIEYFKRSDIGNKIDNFLIQKK